MPDIKIVKVPDQITKSFVDCYGKVDEHLDEDTWMSWFGIWYNAWEEAIRCLPHLRGLSQVIRNELVDAIAIMDEKGRKNEGDNSRLLWLKDWDRVRQSLLGGIRFIDGETKC